MSGNPQPWDFEEARTNSNNAARDQKQAEDWIRRASKDLASKERNYRLELAKEITRQHSAGCSWTAAQDLARGNKFVADLRYERDVSEGVKAAAESSVWRHTANRKDTLEFIQWSRIVAPTGQREPQWNLRHRGEERQGEAA